MTTEGMPERIYTYHDGFSVQMTDFESEDADSFKTHEYTRTSWLIQRLEGMKKEKPYTKQTDCECTACASWGAAIDAVIALVREG